MSYRNKRGVGARWIGNSGPRLGDRTIGRSKLGWGGQKRNTGPRNTSIVMVPVTNSERCIFPYSEIHYKFDARYYKPEHTDGKMSVEEAFSFLSHIDNFTAPARQEWGKGYNQAAGVLLFIAVMAFLISVPVTLVALDINFPVPIVVTAIIVGICAVLLLVIRCYVNSRRAEIMDGCIKNIQGFIAQHESSFKGRNLYWVIPIHFPWWIELWKGEPKVAPNRPDNGQYELISKKAGPKMTSVPQQQYGQPQYGQQQYPQQQQYDQDYSQSQFVGGTQASFRTSNHHQGGFQNQQGGFTAQQGGGGGFMMSSGRTHPL